MHKTLVLDPDLVVWGVGSPVRFQLDIRKALGVGSGVRLGFSDKDTGCLEIKIRGSKPDGSES